MLECSSWSMGRLSGATFLNKTGLSLPQRLLTAIFLAKGGIDEPFRHPCWDSAQVLCMQSQVLWVHVCSLSCAATNASLQTSLVPSLTIFHSLPPQPSLCLVLSRSLHTDHSWVSVLVATDYRKEFLWRKMKDATIYGCNDKKTGAVYFYVHLPE